MKTIKELELKSERIETLHNVFSSRKETNVTASKHKDSVKKGIVVRGQTVIIKSNFEIAGKRRPDGTTPSKRDIGSHASQSLNYMNNHGNDDIKDDVHLSNIYDESGERISRESFNEMRKDLEENGLQASRRTMISINQDLTREECIQIAKESLDTFKDLTDKNFDYKFAIHTDHERPHIHAFMSSDTGRDILINKEQMQLLKEIVADKTETILQSKELDKSIEKVKELKADIGGIEQWKLLYF